jgi:hypothetical protein
MKTRTGLLGLAVCAAVAGWAAAKPPGLPLNPHDQGKEPPPVARDFHQADEPMPPLSFPLRVPAGRPTGPALDVREVAGFVTAAHDAVMNHFTIPLGLASLWK